MKLKIVILDACTTTEVLVGETRQGEPDWNQLAELGELTVYPRTMPDEVVARCQGAAIVLTNKVVLHREIISQLTELKYIGLMSTGTNSVDLKEASRRGIVVTNVPAYSTASVAQHTIALLLELAIRMRSQINLAVDLTWSSQPDFSIYESPILELAGKTFGIVGCGSIAQATAKIAHAMGMRLLVHSRSERSVDFPCEWVSKDEILFQSDALSLHCPLSEETEHWINTESLEKMKPSAFLINTGRGPLVDENAVAEALRNGKLAGYGADVSTVEPPSRENPILHAPNAVLTPHVAWASREARFRLVKQLEQNIQAFLKGDPINTAG